ncbi:MAG: DUF364 domain-containing protein [Dissulfurispiraceae bacterium]|jgi:hypothetical protein|nr:DUF364 domain-containing protein [Dissulfurispiraceae bacterium]
MRFYSDLKTKFSSMAQEHNFLDEAVTVVSARTLTPEEAIGKPDIKDFPLLKGKEVMIEASFKNSKGQAYTDMPGSFNGSIRDIMALPLDNNLQRAVFISTLNAVMRSLGLAGNTIHCRDKEPAQCASQLKEYVTRFMPDPKIAFIGYQPAMISRLSESFKMRVVDLDADNIGKEKFGIIVEGPENTEEALNWSDLIMATGSTSVNGTVTKFITEKPVIFYGITIAGVAKILGYNNYCPCSH